MTTPMGDLAAALAMWICVPLGYLGLLLLAYHSQPRFERWVNRKFGAMWGRAVAARRKIRSSLR